MPIGPGARFGPYEILGSVGAGGMGEVYRARDPRLGREVAVKVLPPQFAGDPDRLRRFELEARAAGALNHPNVLGVLDLGSENGHPYVVSELLEGETLRQRLRVAALTPKKAMEVAVQIAHGLAAAHDKGIVHRDLKPENLFVTREGRREDPRLRPGQAQPRRLARGRGHARERRHAARRRRGGHRSGRHPGHRRLHVARAGARAAGRRALGHLLLRRRALRDGLGPSALCARDARRDAHRNPQGRSPGARRDPPERAPRARARGAPLPGEEPRRALPLGARRGLRDRRAVVFVARSRRARAGCGRTAREAGADGSWRRAAGPPRGRRLACRRRAPGARHRRLPLHADRDGARLRGLPRVVARRQHARLPARSGRGAAGLHARAERLDALADHAHPARLPASRSGRPTARTSTSCRRPPATRACGA